MRQQCPVCCIGFESFCALLQESAPLHQEAMRASSMPPSLLMDCSSCPTLCASSLWTRHASTAYTFFPRLKQRPLADHRYQCWNGVHVVHLRLAKDLRSLGRPLWHLSTAPVEILLIVLLALQVGRRSLLISGSLLGLGADYATAVVFAVTYAGGASLPQAGAIASVILVRLLHFFTPWSSSA